jgi:hypothetical protein
MFDFDVEILHNNELVPVNLSNHLKNKTVLMCPAINNMAYPTLDYYKYIDSLLDLYKIDEILLINPTDDLFFHMHISSHFPRLVTVTDRQQNYIRELKQHKKMQESHEELVKKWAFQLLFINGVEKGFWQQPLSNQWHYFLRKKETIKSILQKKSEYNTPRAEIAKVLKNLHETQKKSNIYDLVCFNWLKVNTGGLTILKDLGPLIYYFNLFNNKELEAKLVLQKNNRHKYQV